MRRRESPRPSLRFHTRQRSRHAWLRAWSVRSVKAFELETGAIEDDYSSVKILPQTQVHFIGSTDRVMYWSSLAVRAESHQLVGFRLERGRFFALTKTTQPATREAFLLLKAQRVRRAFKVL